MNLTSLPASISLFSLATNFDMRNNTLKDIPPAIFSFSKLEHLY